MPVSMPVLKTRLQAEPYCLLNSPLALVLAFVLAFVLAGCNEEPPEKAAAPAGPPVVGVLLYKKDDTYIALVADALTRAFADRAVVRMYSADNDQLTQNDQLESLLESGVSALVVNIVDPKAAAGVVDRVKKAGIPVVFFNREPDLSAIRQYGKACFVGTTAFDAGKLQGDIIKALWDAHPEYDRNKDGVLQYVMFQGNPDNPEALARTEYSVKQAREQGLAMRQIGETYVCDWDEQQAGEAMRMAVIAHGPDIELVIANNDSMALGAVSALAEAGFNTGLPGAAFIPVVGVDATPQAMEAIKKGVMSATVKQDGEAMARAIAELTLNAVNNRDFLEGTPYIWDASGVAIRIPYSPFSGD